MTRASDTRTAWAHGFVSGVAVCALAAYVGRKYATGGPRIVQDDGTIIPIE